MFYCNLDAGVIMDPSAYEMFYKGKLWIVNARKDARPLGVVHHRLRQGQLVAVFYIDCWGRQRVIIDIEE